MTRKRPTLKKILKVGDRIQAQVNVRTQLATLNLVSGCNKVLEQLRCGTTGSTLLELEKLVADALEFARQHFIGRVATRGVTTLRRLERTSKTRRQASRKNKRKQVRA